MRIKRSRAAVLGSAVFMAAGTAAGCGSSDEESTAGSATGKAASAPALSLTTAAPLTGQYFQAPEYGAGLQAAAASINAAGGVAGRQIELDVCDTKFTANGEVACARKMVASKTPAVVGPFLVADASGAAWPVLAKAGIPAIGQQGGGPVEMNSPNVFPLGSSFLGPFVGTAKAAADAGAKNVVVLSDDPNPAGPIIAKLITGALKQRGGVNVKSVTGRTASDPTFATAAAQATAGGTDAILLNASPNTVATMIKALRSGGFDGKLVTPALLVPQQTIDALGEGAEGVMVVSANAFVTDEDNPGVQKYLADMKKYEPKAKLTDASMQGWSAMQLFAKAAATGKGLDAPSLTKTFSAIEEPIDIGTSGPWSVAGKLGKVPGFSRIVNAKVAIGVVEDGKVVPQGDGFVDPFAPAQ